MQNNNKERKNPVFLMGDNIYLRPVKKEDLIYILKWVNDPEVRGIIGEVSSMSSAQGDKYFEKICNDSNREWFMVLLKDGDRVIGECGFLRMFYPWRTTDVSLIIGEKDVWGKGYGREAIFLLLDYAFGYLNFHRVAIGVVAFNKRALKFWEKAGFKKEGVQRDGYFYNHKYHNFIMMSILENEFRVLYKKQICRG